MQSVCEVQMTLMKLVREIKEMWGYVERTSKSMGLP